MRYAVLTAAVAISACGSTMPTGTPLPRHTGRATPRATATPAPTPPAPPPAAAALVLAATGLPWGGMRPTVYPPTAFGGAPVPNQADIAFYPAPGSRAATDGDYVEIFMAVTCCRNNALNLFQPYSTVGALTPPNATGPAVPLGDQGLGRDGADTFVTVPVRDHGVAFTDYYEIFTEGSVVCEVLTGAHPGRLSAATAHSIAVTEDSLITGTPGTAG